MAGTVHPDAGQLLSREKLLDIAGLLRAYHDVRPNPERETERVRFGTSGHRGSSFDASFNEAHILAISQAICHYRSSNGIDGPLFIGRDTHALSKPAFETAIEVFIANGITVLTDAHGGFTPTPALSHAILAHNRSGDGGLADGVIVTPSHNPPEDGGFKYNPPHGGPAESKVTGAIERLANRFLENRLEGVRRVALHGSPAGEVRRADIRGAYAEALASVVDLEAIRSSGIRMGIDPLGGAAVDYWPVIIERYGLDAELVSDRMDPTFAFMPADHDGRIRMDCSSPYAMANLIRLKDDYDVAFGNDPDADRYGIVTPDAGLMPPNDFLAVAISYLLGHRPGWSRDSGIGKTMVTSALIDRIAAQRGRPLVETPVGFKWFVEGLTAGTLAFAGEESAGASLLRMDGTVWTTEKDGIALALLAAEIRARSGADPALLYRDLTERLGRPHYRRTDAPVSREEKARLERLSERSFTAEYLAGEPVVAVESSAPGTGAPLGGIRVRSASGWFAARPSGTEAIYKLYAESFIDGGHLEQIEREAQAMISAALAGPAEGSRVEPGR